MSNLCVIPARMASSRYPGKPLVPLLGLALVLHVWERCRLSASLDRIVVATCDDEIRKACEARGAEVVMTADIHPGCVDRTDEAIQRIGGELRDDDLVLMVQGDEVMVTPEIIDDLVATFAMGDASVVNLASRLYTNAAFEDVNAVKVAMAPDLRALYMSRAAIPSRARDDRDDGAFPMYQQTGIMGFSKAFVRRFGELPQTPMERIERIDMLRVIEHGLTVQMVITDHETIGVDTPADKTRAEEHLRRDPTTSRYLEGAP